MSFNNWIKAPFEKSSFQFWKHFCLYAVSNAVFKIAQKLLISFFNTFSYLEDFVFLFAAVPGKI